MRETDSFLVTPDEPLPLALAQPTDGNCTISILSLAQCESILPDWRALAATALEDNPFLSPDFMIPARSHLIDDSGTALALAWEEHDGMRTLTGLFPLVPRTRDFGAGWLVQSRAALSDLAFTYNVTSAANKMQQAVAADDHLLWRQW